MSNILGNLQQQYQNTYTNQQINTQQQQYISGGNVAIIIPSGVYDANQSIFNCGIFTSAINQGEETIWMRTDTFIPCAGARCTVQLDGETIGTYQNLGLAQLEYRQKYYYDDDQIIDCGQNGAMQTQAAPCLTKKRWKQLGYVIAGVTKFNNGFRFKHFLPFLFPEDQHHLIIKKQMNINIQLNPQFDNSTIASYQLTGQQIQTNDYQTVNQGVGANNVLAIGVPYIAPPGTLYPSLYINGGGIGTQLFPLPYINQYADPITIQLNMKRLIQNQYSQIESYPYQSYFVQIVSPGDSGDVFNQTISENQISQYQSISIIPEKTTGNNITQFNFEDVSQGVSSYLQIQRQGQKILDALSLSDAKAQAMIWKDKNKFNNNNLILQFDEILTNTNLQTNVQSGMGNIQYIVQSSNTSQQPNGSFQNVIGSGVFEIDGSCVAAVYNGVKVTTNDNPVYARADCFIPAQSSTIVTIDGVQRGQFLNLSAAQLAYSQDLDTFQGRELDIDPAAGSSNSIKKFKLLGNGVTNATDANGRNYVQTFQLRHFLPYIFNEEDKYFKVDSMMNVTINLGSTPFINCLAQQDAPTFVNAPIQSVSTCASIDLFFLLKRVTNQVETAAASISPHITCYLQQKQSINTGTTFNQSFGANQISTKQQMCLLPTDGNGSQSNFEDPLAPYTVLPSLTIQRCGVIILQAPLGSGNTQGYGDIYEQLQLQKSVNKKDYQNMIHTFHTIFSNANLQTIFQYSAGGGSALTAVMGYTYITQLPQQLPM